MRATVVELDARPDDVVSHRAGHQHLVGSCQGAYARADMYGDPADVVAAHLTLAGVQSCAHLDAERPGD